MGFHRQNKKKKIEEKRSEGTLQRKLKHKEMVEDYKRRKIRKRREKKIRRNTRHERREKTAGGRGTS